MSDTGHAIIPGAGVTRRLPRLISKAIAKDLILTGRKVYGREAEALGLANYCVPAGEAYTKALEVARIINEKGPIAVRAGKRAIEEGLLIIDSAEAADFLEGFSSDPETSMGLVQHEGGPCGVLRCS